jgi:hypothetical protein
MWLSSVYGGLQVQPAPVCHPCRGFLVILDAFPHRFHGGLSCGVPFQAGSKSPTRQSQRYGDGA